MLIFVVPEGQLNASTQKGDATQSSTQSKGVFKANQVLLDTRPNLPSRRLPCVHSAKAHRARFVPLFSAECFFFFPIDIYIPYNAITALSPVTTYFHISVAVISVNISLMYM